MKENKIIYKSANELLEYLRNKEKATKNINYLKYKVNKTIISEGKSK